MLGFHCDACQSSSHDTIAHDPCPVTVSKDWIAWLQRVTAVEHDAVDYPDHD